MRPSSCLLNRSTSCVKNSTWTYFRVSFSAPVEVSEHTAAQNVLVVSSFSPFDWLGWLCMDRNQDTQNIIAANTWDAVVLFNLDGWSTASVGRKRPSFVLWSHYSLLMVWSWTCFSPSPTLQWKSDDSRAVLFAVTARQHQQTTARQNLIKLRSWTVQPWSRIKITLCADCVYVNFYVKSSSHSFLIIYR